MTHPMTSTAGRDIPAFLRQLNSVAIARLTVEGRVLDANLGFWRLIGHDPLPAGCLMDVAAFFHNPPLGELLRVFSTNLPTDAPLFQGLITLGDVNSFSQTINGAIYRDGDDVLVMGEHDISDMQRLSMEVLQLNTELAEAQRGLIRQNQTLQRSNQLILDTSRTDPLTGIANRRRFDERLLEELDRCHRTGGGLSLALADVDHFKQVNDDFGHLAGDAVLKALALAMRAGTRPYDLVARWGGEEFIILLPDTEPERAVEVADRIRLAFSGGTVPEVNRSVTVSFGIAAARPRDSAETLLARADAALYRAKEDGRNRVRTEIQGLSGAATAGVLPV